VILLGGNMENLVFKEDIILNVEDILYLYNDVGWSSYTKNIDSLIKSIKNSLKVISVWDNDLLVGLIRVVGDGHSIIYIQDILILQKYQNSGIGKRLIEIILDKYKNVRQKVLLTDKEEKNILFYKKVGFSMAEEFGCVSFVKF
jgi:ribosomal protein S18 acetylase RimI-like enzyme